MDTKKILIEVLGGKKFKAEPLSSKIYFFHFSWTDKGELQVVYGDSNTQMGRGMFEVVIKSDGRETMIFFDDKSYTIDSICIAFHGKSEIVLLDAKSEKHLKLREVEDIKF